VARRRGELDLKQLIQFNRDPISNPLPKSVDVKDIPTKFDVIRTLAKAIYSLHKKELTSMHIDDSKIIFLRSEDNCLEPFISLFWPANTFENSDSTKTGKFHGQGDAKWIVIRRPSRGHNDMPFGWPTPGQPVAHPGVGHPQGIFGIFSYY
jgi:hypothetical protein